MGREALVLYERGDGMSLVEVPVEQSGAYRPQCVIFSGDGALVATQESGTFVLRTTR